MEENPLRYAQEDLSTQTHSQEAKTWLPEADEHAQWPGHPVPAAAEGPEASGRPVRMGLARRRRLTRRVDFARVMDQGRARSNALVVLRFCPSDVGGTRIGVTAGRRTGAAVRRNRAKRVLREAIRPIPLQTGWDLVFIARPAIVQAEFGAVRAAVRDVLTAITSRRFEARRPRVPNVDTSALQASVGPRRQEQRGRK